MSMCTVPSRGGHLERSPWTDIVGLCGGSKEEGSEKGSGWGWLTGLSWKRNGRASSGSMSKRQSHSPPARSK